jgi:hypothetical protein
VLLDGEGVSSPSIWPLLSTQNLPEQRESQLAEAAERLGRCGNWAEEADSGRGRLPIEATSFSKYLEPNPERPRRRGSWAEGPALGAGGACTPRRFSRITWNLILERAYASLETVRESKLEAQTA